MNCIKRNRVIIISCYIADTGATVRDAAKVFGISKSTVHKDITEKLPLIDSVLAERVNHVLQINKSERHIRGGNATKLKFMTMHKLNSES